MFNVGAVVGATNSKKATTDMGKSSAMGAMGKPIDEQEKKKRRKKALEGISKGSKGLGEGFGSTNRDEYNIKSRAPKMKALMMILGKGK
jgi:hypothetical protein